MILPDDFQFSQASLQDYVDCPKRFQLRYILKLSWPAIRAEPVSELEKQLQRGTVFHRMVHQHILGIPEENISNMITDEDLSFWWKNYLEYKPYLSGKLYPEIILSTPVEGYRMVAKYDLITVNDSLFIIDWKTSRKLPRREWLQERIQTKLYSCLLKEAGSHLIEGQMVRPEKIQMIYWFPQFPENPEYFQYSEEEYKKDSSYLISLIREIKNLKNKEFPMTDNKRHCFYCHYRSLCQRGVKAGLIEDATDLEEDISPYFNFEEIEEVEF
ncbi:MAG TPA: PD-(D/E)XK nuclease family protein [Candidatus Eremiobacteraeota bacterium]|nr:MAG: PD-(D/E)XK nuclease superfamily protein [bacterium ADurb.Bin363]HPZ07150.1 PD-(D/E)XK nuclease family protein [Candidatus Eremiobacteraeota bacterium]